MIQVATLLPFGVKYVPTFDIGCLHFHSQNEAFAYV